MQFDTNLFLNYAKKVKEEIKIHTGSEPVDKKPNIQHSTFNIQFPANLLWFISL